MISSDHAPHTPDTACLAAIFQQARARGSTTVTIPPGDYQLGFAPPIELASGLTVFAYGARFHLPETLGDRVHFDVFRGRDVSDFNWLGGQFFGHCFDHRRHDNTWEPNVCTRAIVITTSPGGLCRNLVFRDISAHRVAGAVVTVEGVCSRHSDSEVVNYAENVTMENCTFLESGKFMWDYGMLWQIAVWPEDYTAHDQTLVERYFRHDLVREGIRMTDGDDRVFFDNTRPEPIRVSVAGTPHHSVCFYHDSLPQNIVRGRQYFVVDATADYIRVSPAQGGQPVRFVGSSGPATRMMHNLFACFMELYAPIGQGLGKGCFDFVGCRNIRVAGCKISALGDTMHIQLSRDIIFAQNHILGSRMGAFFLAEHCKNSTIIGNLVEGTNGSRVISIERSNEDVIVIGNTFRGGGRGSWINQPKNLIFQGNIFTDNTTKGRPEPWSGRRTYRTGTWESYPEMYFSVWEKGAGYGPVLLRDNIFTTGPEAMAALQFERGARDVLIEGNLFCGQTGAIRIDQPNPGVNIGLNTGHQVTKTDGAERFVND